MTTFEDLFPGLKFTDARPPKEWTREDALMELEEMEKDLIELRKEVFRKRRELGVER